MHIISKNIGDVKILVMSGVIGAKDSAYFTHKNLFIDKKKNYVH